TRNAGFPARSEIHAPGTGVRAVQVDVHVVAGEGQLHDGVLDAVVEHRGLQRPAACQFTADAHLRVDAGFRLEREVLRRTRKGRRVAARNIGEYLGILTEARIQKTQARQEEEVVVLLTRTVRTGIVGDAVTHLVHGVVLDAQARGDQPVAAADGVLHEQGYRAGLVGLKARQGTTIGFTQHFT